MSKYREFNLRENKSGWYKYYETRICILKNSLLIQFWIDTGKFEYFIWDKFWHKIRRNEFKVELKKRSSRLWRTMYGK